MRKDIKIHQLWLLQGGDPCQKFQQLSHLLCCGLLCDLLFPFPETKGTNCHFTPGHAISLCIFFSKHFSELFLLSCWWVSGCVEGRFLGIHIQHLFNPFLCLRAPQCIFVGLFVFYFGLLLFLISRSFEVFSLSLAGTNFSHWQKKKELLKGFLSLEEDLIPGHFLLKLVGKQCCLSKTETALFTHT